MGSSENEDLKDALKGWFFIVLLIPYVVFSFFYVLGFEIYYKIFRRNKHEDPKREKERESTIISYA
jgi:hypothetical protein